MVLITSFSLTQQGIRPGLGNLQVENKKDVNFHCAYCKEDLDIKMVEIRCCHCGDVFPIEVLSKPKTLSGIYCPDCLREIAPLLEKNGIQIVTKPITDLIKKLDLPR
jgi:hypothetical protein